MSACLMHATGVLSPGRQTRRVKLGGGVCGWADMPLVCPAVVLKPELFEGLRFDFTKPLNQNFALSHRCVKSAGCITHMTSATCA